LAEEPDKKDDKFEFTPEGEFVEYISLGDARVMAIRHARENTEIYGADYQDTTMVWEPVSQIEEEEFYEIQHYPEVLSGAVVADSPKNKTT
jgi:hypothetical protein